MKTNTSERIIFIVEQNGQIRPYDLVKKLGISQVAVHKQLKKLVTQGKLIKKGKAPLVFYSLPVIDTREATALNLDEGKLGLIRKEYLYVTATGQLKYGVDGFISWFNNTRQNQDIVSLAKEYIQVKTKLYSGGSLLVAIKKFKSTFKKCFLEEVYYSDFYSLPKFGKTKLGMMVLHAKQSQYEPLIREIAEQIKPDIEKIIVENKIQAVAFIPHSIPRKLPFLKILKKQLNLNLPMIDLVKAYSGELPVAQKSLPKLSERIKNARETILVKNNEINFNKILLIDDAVGSGATLNESAAKIKKISSQTVVFGYAIVGSMKGFEVISEV